VGAPIWCLGTVADDMTHVPVPAASIQMEVLATA